MAAVLFGNLDKINNTNQLDERKKERSTFEVAKYFARSYIFQSQEDSKTNFTAKKAHIASSITNFGIIKIVLLAASIFFGIGALIRAINAGALLMQAKTFSAIAAFAYSIAWAAGANNLFVLSKVPSVFHRIWGSIDRELPNAEALTPVQDEEVFLNTVFNDSFQTEDLSSSERPIRKQCLDFAERPFKQNNIGRLNFRILDYTLLLPMHIAIGICSRILPKPAAPISAQ